MSNESVTMITNAEKIVKRKLGRNDQESIQYWMEQGIPYEVILHIVEYCVQARKVNNFSYIGAVLADAKKKSVSTLEDAKEKYPIPDEERIDYSSNMSIISIRMSCHSNVEKVKALQRLQEVFILEKVNTVNDKENPETIHTYIEASFK